MTLVIAGSYGVDFETAEDIKTDKKREKEVCIQITPVLQKMASIVKKYISAYDVKDVYLVGGACSFEDSEKIFSEVVSERLNSPDLKYNEETFDVIYTKEGKNWDIDPNKNDKLIKVMALDMEL